MSNVIELGNITRLDLPADKVLDNLKGELEGIVYVGFDHNGEIYAGSSYADGGTVMWLLEWAKQQLMGSGDD